MPIAFHLQGLHRVGRWRRNAATIAAAAVASLGACTPQLGPPPGSVVDAPATTDEQTSPAARDQYVSQSLADHPPPGVGARHLYAVGSGFYVAPDELLTNFHVAGKCGAITIGNDTEGDEVMATIVAGDPVVDLALLRTDEQVAKPALFATPADGTVAEPLSIVGYPEHGLPVRIAELSPVSAKTADVGTMQDHYRFDGEVRRGNSGGPVLDASGSVLGVVVMKIDTVATYQKTGEVIDNVGFAISNRAVFDFLRASRVNTQLAAESGGPMLDSAALLDRAHGFVRQIGCWR